MYESLIYTIPNPTFVINAQLQSIEIPSNFNQILHYDKNGKCVQFSKNIRYLPGGLNAGVVTDSRIYYTGVPEQPTLSKLDINHFDRNKRCEIYVKELPKNSVSFSITQSNKTPEDSCDISESVDSYVVKI